MKEEDVFSNIQHSIIFYMQEIFCLAFGFYREKIVNVGNPKVGDRIFLSNNIMLLDASGKATVNNVVVKSGSNMVDYNKFFVDYNSGELVVISDIGQNITATIKDRIIDITDVFPDIESESFDNQIMSIELEDVHSRPFELGSKKKYWKTNYFFNVFCFNKMLRKSVSSRLLLQFSKYGIPLIDFKKNYPIGGDGRININFDIKYCSEMMMVDFGEPSSETINFESQNKKTMYCSNIFGILTLIF